MHPQWRSLSSETLQRSETLPDQIAATSLGTIGAHVVRYVRWTPGTVYPDHVHSDTEYIFVIEGDLADGDRSFGPRTLLTYPPGSGHDRLRTQRGTEFILIRTAPERMRFGTRPEGAEVSVSEIGREHLIASARHPGIGSALLARIGDYQVVYVVWSAGTAYSDHRHLDPEYIYITCGVLVDGGRTFGPRTLITYPPGSAHDHLHTVNGAAFLLIWTGRERADYAPEGRRSR